MLVDRGPVLSDLEHCKASDLKCVNKCVLATTITIVKVSTHSFIRIQKVGRKVLIAI